VSAEPVGAVLRVRALVFLLVLHLPRDRQTKMLGCDKHSADGFMGDMIRAGDLAQGFALLHSSDYLWPARGIDNRRANCSEFTMKVGRQPKLSLKEGPFTTQK